MTVSESEVVPGSIFVIYFYYTFIYTKISFQADKFFDKILLETISFQADK